ncbi:MAG: CDP-glycerol glycerophosphotransferase family protein [Rhodoluna sp.]|nr:CDP-glycerol glycerophosphotransferase family protein [Rhodoluna sp.]
MDVKRLIKTYSPTRVMGALRRRGSAYIRKLQYHPGRTKQLESAVLFESHRGSMVGCNPLDIFLELKATHPELKFYWAVGKGIAAPEGSQAVEFGTGPYLRALATSKWLVNNTNFPWYFRKVEGQVYLQTWHGTPLKRLARDIATNYLTKSYLDTMDREAGYWDYLITPNEFCTVILPNAFGFNAQVIESGYPRNDRLTTSTAKDRQRIRESLGVSDPSVNLVLYAPTWRDFKRTATGKWDTVNFMDPNIELPDGFKMMFRGHSNTIDAHSAKVAGNAIDVTTYPDVTDLYIAADVLITDYSSVMFDYTVTGKPIMFLAPDLERYRAERGFYFDFENEAPGPILQDDSEVLAALPRLDAISNQYLDKYRAWQQKFNDLEDGKAAKRVVKRVWG